MRDLFRQMLFWGFASLALAACSRGPSPAQEGYRFILPAPTDDPKNYELREVVIRTLGEPHLLAGQAAQIFYRSGGADERGFSGRIARPRLALAQGVYVPLDVQSALSIAVYANFEHLQLFDRALGWEGNLRWPRQVGVDVDILTLRGRMHNNAVYDAQSDVIAVAPFMRGNLAIALNQGILAHEHFHAHFQNLWHKSVPKGVQAPDGPPGSNASFIFRTNANILAAWNEGLADFYAAMYTGSPRSMEASMPELLFQRRLDAAVGRIPQLDAYLDSLGCRHNPLCIEQSGEGLYILGTQVARALYAWDRALQSKASQFAVLKAIFKVLPQLFIDLSRWPEDRTLDPALLIERIAAEADVLNGTACEILKAALPSASWQTVEPRCAKINRSKP